MPITVVIIKFILNWGSAPVDGFQPNPVGVSLQYDEAATASTREAVKGVLTSAFAAKAATAAQK